MKMDRYELVFDIIEHPEKYTIDRLNEILSDPETREIYNIICKTDSAVEAATEINVNTEWEQFERKHNLRQHRSWMWVGSRAASIAMIVGSSLAAVAAGIAVTVAVMDHKSASTPDNGAEVAVTSKVPSAEILTEDTDTTNAKIAPIMFEDTPLESIMVTIAETYGVEVKFNNREAAELHLFYRLNPSLTLDEIISQLNTFERINIVRDGDTLIID